MEEEEKSKGFKVEDRRRFSSEGELKPEFQSEQAESAPKPAAESASTGAAQGGAARLVGSPRSDDQPPAGELTFASFMVGLSTQALFHLGELQETDSNSAAVDLGAAQQLIDIVGMLKEKTRGNLDKDEQALIDAILFELRMKYVEKKRRG